VSLDPREVLEQYEVLRREALGTAPFGPRGHGLALLLSRGLPAWLVALTALAPPGGPTRSLVEPRREGGSGLLPTARAELTTVLAGMVLACTHPTEGPGCTARAR
jgi:hypothetical protein